MIFNRPKRREKKRLTWVVKNLSWSTVSQDARFYATFVSNGTLFYGIVTQDSDDVLYYIQSVIQGTTYVQQVYKSPIIGSASWTNEAYRTITFDTEPTGTLLTWLEANATPQ